MSTVTIMPSGKSIEAAEGMTLLAAVLAADVGISHTCDGNAECGTCHIFVQEGRKGLTKTTKAENERLDAIVGVGSKSRLACQAKVTGTENVKIEILDFASGR
jgi:ferredoxin, 2Fe-2S